MFLKSLAINSDQTARLLEHDFGDRWGNRFTEQAVLMTVIATRISPSGELIGGRCMSDVGRATAHDEAKHHLRRAVSGIPQRHCLLYKRSRHLLQESFMFTVIFIRRFPSERKSNKNLPHYHLEQNGGQQNVSARRLSAVILASVNRPYASLPSSVCRPWYSLSSIGRRTNNGRRTQSGALSCPCRTD
jgi:hypothetical protein